MKTQNKYLRIGLSILCLFFMIAGYAQTRTITGTVSDAIGPMPGVSVKVKGGKAASVTNNDGHYSINVTTGSVLHFLFMGYETQEVTVDRRDVINVTMIEKSQELNELVVVGYGTMKKRDVTGAISSINAEELIKNAPSNIAGALQSKISGLEILSSSEPGSTSTYRIRGASTLNEEGANPLFIVDGVEYQNIDFINPRDIASIEVLKDAASSAIYGSKSANGVVLITTKLGTTSKPQISINYSLKQAQISHKLPQMNRVEGNEYETLRAYFENRTPAAFVTDTLNPSFKWDNNYQDILFRKALIHQVDVSVSGSEKRMKYFVSSGYLNEQGIQINSFNKRLTSRVNIDYNATSRFTIGNRLSFSIGKNRAVPSGARSRLLSRPPSMALIFDDGTYAPVIASRNNPLAYSKLCINDNKYYDISFNEFLEYKIWKGVSLKSSISGTLYQNNFRYFAPAILSKEQIPSSKNIHTTNFRWTQEDVLTYNTNIDNVHTINAMMGFSLQNFSSEYVKISASDNITEAIKTSSAYETVNLIETKHSWTGNKMASVFGRLSYSYKGKYLFNSNIRYDGSSRFGRNKRWGLFPSVSLGWRFSDEPFMKWSSSVVDDAKLRYSFGKTGNQTAGNFAALSQYSTISYADYIGIYPIQLENNILSWEDTKQQNIGLDLSLFKGRLSLNLDYYRKNTNNILFNMKLPGTTGMNTSYSNLGGIKNQGVEMTITVRNIHTKDITWSTSLNLGINKNKIVSIPEEAVSIYNDVFIVDAGYTLGSMYGYKALQVFPYDQSNAFTSDWKQLTPIFDSKDRFVKYQFNGVDYEGEIKQLRYGTKNGEIFKGGDVMWSDLNGDGIINAEDRQVIGCGQADLVGGFSTDFRYKSFILSGFFAFSFGGDVYNGFESGRSNHKWSTLTMANPVNVAYSWKSPGDIAKYPIPSSIRGVVDNTRLSSSLWIEDGSYIRLKALKLGYELPRKFMNHLRIDSAQLNLMFENFFTWTNYTGFDPEIPSRGFAIGYDSNSYPKAKSVVLGINLNF